MDQSILDSIKKVLGIDASYDVFDPDIIMHTNTIFANLNQLGIGPEAGFQIEDDQSTWRDFLADDINFNNVKTYVYLKVRLLFDPPQNSGTVNAMNEQIKELEWRMYVKGENDRWDQSQIALP